MKTVVPIIVIALVPGAMGAVQEGSLYPEDALLFSDTVQEYLNGEMIVNLAGTDSSLVLFIALQGEGFQHVGTLISGHILGHIFTRG